MKRLEFIMGASALVAVALTASPAATAQENENRDEYGNFVRGPYETNSFGDNWFVGVGGGINVFWNDGYSLAIGPSVDAEFGKWFTPSIGMRLGYQGIQSRYWSDTPSVLGAVRDADNNKYSQKFGYMYVHGDFLFNISNAIGGYKESRFWNLVPYVHTGYYRAYGLDGQDFAENELAVGAGLLHNLRLTERLDLIIDMRGTVVNGRVIRSDGPAIQGSVTAGIAVDLGFPGFVRTSTVLAEMQMANVEIYEAMETAALALEAANAALNLEVDKLALDNAKLYDEMKKLKNQAVPGVDVADFLNGMSPTVYFEIGKAVLSPLEMKHLEFIAENLVSKVDDSAKIVVTVMGLADSNTGTENRNKYLSEARGKYVSDILTDKFGIGKDRIVVRSDVVESTADPEYDRAVMISF